MKICFGKIVPGFHQVLREIYDSKMVNNHCFKHYLVWFSPFTDAEVDLVNSIFYFKLLLLILELQQDNLRSSPPSRFRRFPRAVETS